MTNMEKLLEQLKNEYHNAGIRRETSRDAGEHDRFMMCNGELAAFGQTIMLVKSWIECEAHCAPAGDVLEASEGKDSGTADPVLEHAREGVEKLEQAKRAVNRLEKRNPDFL